MKIALLIDHSRFIGTLAESFEREWEPYYGRQGPGDARADLLARCNRDRLPIALVAVDSDAVVGTVSLDRDASTGLAPSVVGLLVAQEYRRQGIASGLLEAAERLAVDLGHDKLFVSTSLLGELLERTGWQEKGEVEFLNGEQGKVYVRRLTKRPQT